MENLKEEDLKIVDLLIDDIEDIRKERASLIISKERRNKILSLVEKFSIKEKLIVYGGAATHFYLKIKTGKGIYEQVNDYDVFSSNAYHDGLELMKILAKNKYNYVRITERFHKNSFAIWCEHDDVFDITYIDESLKECLSGEKVDNFILVNPYFHLSSIFLELDYPGVNNYRWDKQFKRLRLLIDNEVITYPEYQKKKIFKNKIGDLSDNELESTQDKYLNMIHEKFPDIIFTGNLVYKLLGKMSKKYNLINSNNKIIQIVTNNVDNIREYIESLENKNISIKSIGAFLTILPPRISICYNNIPIIDIFIDRNCVSFNEVNNIRFTNFFYTMRILSAFYFMSQCSKFKFNDYTQYVIHSEDWGVLCNNFMNLNWSRINNSEESEWMVFGSICEGKIIDRALYNRIEKIKSLPPFRFQSEKNLQKRIDTPITYHDEKTDLLE